MPVVIDKLKAGELVINKTRVGFLVKDRQVVFRRQPAGLTRLTPAMTSNTAPAPFVASASSVYSTGTGFQAANAYSQRADPNIGSSDTWFSGPVFSGGTGMAWNQIYLGPVARTLRHVVLRVRGVQPSQGDMDQTPRDFVLQGSVDGVNFTDLETVVDSPRPLAGPGYGIFHETDVNAVINYFRVYITKTWNGSLGVAAIGEIELYG